MENARQLVVILFADIAGYTSLMQKDEVSASLLIQHFQQEVEQKVPLHHGRIIDIYGDGALCTFSNTLDAVHCAMDLQTNFKTAPSLPNGQIGVPVRVGLHSGTVVFQNNRIFGDSVNLASRIESISIPGAILLSKKVRDDIKNQQSLIITTLGSFEFKNVDEPMQVFALANEGFVIPKREEIQGKLKEGSLDKSIAVLPFSNMSGNPDEEYFSDGITEEIIHALAQLKDLKVTGRTSAFSFKGKEIDLREVGQKLNVGTVLEGSFRKAGNRIRITAQLIKVSDGFHLWSERYDRELTDVFEVQDEIANTIAEKLKVTLFDAPAEQVSSQTKNIEAYQAYLRGKYFQGKRIEGYPKAIEYYEKAIKLDPTYASAYTGLGFIYFYMAAYGMMSPNEAYPKAKELATKALSINPQHAEGHTLMGGIAFCYEWDWDTTFRHLEIATKLNPTDLEFYKGSAMIKLTIGSLEKAIAASRKAIELEPINPDAWVELPYIYLTTKQYEEAWKATKEMEELDPSYHEVYRLLGSNLELQGKIEEAIPYFEKANEMANGEGFAPFYLAIALAKIGKQDHARNMLNGMLAQAKENFVPPLFVACIYAVLNEMDNAYSWLDKAFEEKDGMLVYLLVEPIFASLQADPRFDSYLQRLNLPSHIMERYRAE